MIIGNPKLGIWRLLLQLLERPQAALALWLCATACALSAQEVTGVYPRYAVAGQLIQFTVEGRQLPLSTTPARGIRHSFSKPGLCISGKALKAATRTRYYFACTFKQGAPAARLSIVSRKKKSKVAAVLWEGSIQVLPGAPRVESIAVSAERPDGQARVSCGTAGLCTTTVGELHATRPALVEVTGINLPSTLLISFAGCRKRGEEDDTLNTRTRTFQCLLRTEGAQTLRLLSAPLAQGGGELANAAMMVSPGPAMQTVATPEPARQ